MSASATRATTHSHDGHGHGHGSHGHAPEAFSTAFAIGTVLNLAFVVVEGGFGIRVRSLALVADAGHNLTDVLGLLLAWIAAGLSRRAPTERKTYGMRRSSILAALANAILLLVAVGGIGWEAVVRFLHPAPVAGGTMMAVAGVGIAVNSLTALMFMRGRHDDMNIRAAFLHLAADAAISAGVVLTGFLILRTGRLWLDPVVSLVLVAAIGVGTWSMLRHSLDLALDVVPPGIDPAAIAAYLRGLPGVSEIHDLHVWGMSTTETALTVHIIKPEIGDDDELLLDISRELSRRFQIHHPTVQIERGQGPTSCLLQPGDVV